MHCLFCVSSLRLRMSLKGFLPLLLLLKAGAVMAVPEKIVVAAFEYPPIYQKSDNDLGVSGDVVVEAFKAVNVDALLKFVPAPRMVHMVDSGSAVCGIGGAILFSSSAANTRLVSKIQYVLQTFLYDSRRYPNGIAYEKIEDMQKYKIGVLNGSGIMRFLEQTPNLNLEHNTKHNNTANQLYIGRVNVWAIVDLTGFQILRQLYPAEAKYFKATKPYNIGDVSFICSKKADPKNIYGEKFKKGFEIIKKNGIYMKIMAKYYGDMSLINKDVLVEDMR